MPHPKARQKDGILPRPMPRCRDKGRDKGTGGVASRCRDPFAMAKNDRNRQLLPFCGRIRGGARPQKASSPRRGLCAGQAIFPISVIFCHSTPAARRNEIGHLPLSRVVALSVSPERPIADRRPIRHAERKDGNSVTPQEARDAPRLFGMRRNARFYSSLTLTYSSLLFPSRLAQGAMPRRVVRVGAVPNEQALTHQCLKHRSGYLGAPPCPTRKNRAGDISGPIVMPLSDPLRRVAPPASRRGYRLRREGAFASLRPASASAARAASAPPTSGAAGAASPVLTSARPSPSPASTGGSGAGSGSAGAA